MPSRDPTPSMAENIPIATPCSGRGAAEYANSSPMERVDMSVSSIRALQYVLQITGHYNLPI